MAVLLALVLAAPSEAQSDESPAAHHAAQAFDAVVLRPLGLAATAIGIGLFPAAALVSAPGGRDAVQEAWEMFVLVPAKNVFQRPLGSF